MEIPNDDLGKRQYKRLEGTFRIEFTIVRLQGDLPGVDWQNGFTRNVSQGGLCLETKELRETTIQFLSKENIYLDLRIHIPMATKPIKAVAEVAWFKPQEDDDAHYIIGLKYRSIIKDDLKKIMGRASVSSFVINLFKGKKK